VEVYGRVPVSASDGVDMIYRLHRGEFTHAIQANYGGAERELPGGGGTVEAKQAWGVTYTVEYHATTVHLAYQRPTLDLDGDDALFDGFRLFGPQGNAIADRYDVDHKPMSIVAIGATYDPGKWFLTAEWTRTENRSFIGNGTSWYVSGGYRLGKFTPYIAYAASDADNLSDPGLDLSGLPPSLVGTAIGLNAGLNELLGKKVVQKTVSVGARWEVTRNAAVKLQLDHTRIGAGSSGWFSNIQPGFQPGGSFNLFSATVDFVF
jgi:predicted porin